VRDVLGPEATSAKTQEKQPAARLMIGHIFWAISLVGIRS